MIPVFRPFAGQEEIDAVAEVLRSGWWGLGPKTREFEVSFGEAVGAKHVVATNSASAALLLSLVSLDLAGREVITPALTFASTNHAIIQAGGRPVFADVDPVTLTIDPAEVERLVSPRTAAIMVVDYAGHPGDLDSIQAIAREHRLSVLEDAAHACGATYRGRTVGSIADATCFSFQAVKNLSTGEGGAVSLADDSRASRLRRLRLFGASRSSWERSAGKTFEWDYDIDELGFKAHMSDIPAAIGLVQLRRLPQMNARRRQIAEAYTSALGELEWLTTPAELPEVRSAWQMYVVRVPERDRFMTHLADHGVSSGVHFKPTHLYRPYRQFSRPLPITDAVWLRLVTLPLFPGLADSSVEQVIEAVRSFRPRIADP